MEIFHERLLVDQLTPVSLYAKLREFFAGETTFLFESAASSSESGTHSFIIIGAKEEVISQGGESFYIDSKGNRQNIGANPFPFLKEYYARLDQSAYRAWGEENGVGFVDGFIGYIGYDIVKFFEPCLKEAMDALEDQTKIPDMRLIRPRWIFCYSHKNAHLSMLTQDPQEAKRFEALKSTLHSKEPFRELLPLKNAKSGSFYHDKERFFGMVDESLERIRSGDVFQILISNRYIQEAEIDPFSFYRILRGKNPSPYLFLLEFPDFAIAGSSPEVMVRLQENSILLRPIAGTRKRGKNRLRDRELELELKSDTKECAEHVMLIDLGRNDVGRVAKSGSVKVGEVMRIERYSHVMHMVSDVEGELKEGKDMFDLFAATFTAGTMTGAPKIKAMEIIAELEGLKRGFYSGAVGYFGFSGDMDSAITIRTALIKPDKIFLQAGAGIVADSQKELEHLEVTNKLGALTSTLQELAKL
ncbi:anthranilate synthase component I family protein [Wolinella succinogenes]|uniref:Anthranilate synthase component 1 n=1 Tax=Wolinella succinogenes (strain ATCC 29543 / DSM 1740 / CCUG 13145 / JCM 31913 / LMG 7466 / NCTC 11488 / FDC 602W) TaxID=273121 RepID=Q7MAQ9_WOLSU|nr:anthranilate synthase component I family protein [Wolinella succinogenes]CAE09256.1 ANTHRANILATE SYNTHASE COMPONENT I [Wolinella succinogenes]VEG81468.1 Anthranilate synthase component 1 [Wolinella succinogenes]HCZ19618.1 anthranilate synthase component I family protein [Helicobacter sp.]